ncbi:MAG: sulfite exporter TauE/SafE family protein [Vulcanimicrobiaceae bacterium]
MSFDLEISLVGLVVGTLVGLTGIGGSAIMAPLLVLALGVKPSIAVGTDLLYSVPTKLLAFGLHARAGSVDWPLTRGLLYGGIPGALAGLAAYQALRVHLDPHTLEAALRHAIGITILLACIGATLTWVLRARKRHAAALDAPVPRSNATIVAIGALVGALVSLTSIGSGSITLPLLVLALPALTLRRLIGSEIAFAAFLVPVAALGHASFGNVDGRLAVSLLAGSLPGVWLGSRLSATVGDIWLRPIVVGALAIAGLRLV